MNKAEIGSITARGGFINEDIICEKFINYKDDETAQKWLAIMGYLPSKIQSLSAMRISPRINLEKALELGVSEKGFEESRIHQKADIQIVIKITIDNITYIQNISLKKSNASAGYNQVDKRKVQKYKQFWSFNSEIEYWLKVFTGEILPSKVARKDRPRSLRDKKERRMFLDEIPELAYKKIKLFFDQNKTLVITDILRGRGGLAADWFLVTKKSANSEFSWTLVDINTVCNFYSQGEVEMSPRASLKIGKITMQRKGGTPDPTSLQFKMNPLELFKLSLQ
jgi:hypothetical protein